LLGYNVEYSSVGFALFFIGEYMHIIFMSVLSVIIFFGGWQPPTTPPERLLLFFLTPSIVCSFDFLIHVLNCDKHPFISFIWEGFILTPYWHMIVENAGVDTSELSLHRDLTSNYKFILRVCIGVATSIMLYGLGLVRYIAYLDFILACLYGALGLLFHIPPSIMVIVADLCWVSKIPVLEGIGTSIFKTTNKIAIFYHSVPDKMYDFFILLNEISLNLFIYSRM